MLSKRLQGHGSGYPQGGIKIAFMGSQATFGQSGSPRSITDNRDIIPLACRDLSLELVRVFPDVFSPQFLHLFEFH